MRRGAVTLGRCDSIARALDLIRRVAFVGAKAGSRGVAGLDEDNGGEMLVLSFFVTGKGIH